MKIFKCPMNRGMGKVWYKCKVKYHVVIRNVEEVLCNVNKTKGYHAKQSKVEGGRIDYTVGKAFSLQATNPHLILRIPIWSSEPASSHF